MSKEAIARRKKEILDAIADPRVREHYRLQLEEAEELEEEGVVTAFHEVFEDAPREEPNLGSLSLPEQEGVLGGPQLTPAQIEEISRHLGEPRGAPRRSRVPLVLGIAIGIGLALLLWFLGKL